MKTIKYRCKLCGKQFDVEEGSAAVGPVCGATADKLEIIESTPASK